MLVYLRSELLGVPGYIFKVNSRDYYVVNERNRQRVRTRNPDVKIFRSGNTYKLVIEDFDEPVICKKIKDVIETQIDGDFEGWEGETIFKMMKNAKYFYQQILYLVEYHYHIHLINLLHNMIKMG